MGMYQNKEDYERATTFGHYSLPESFPEGSDYAKYLGTGLGVKFRIHPFAAALARCQLRGLDERNAVGVTQVRRPRHASDAVNSCGSGSLLASQHGTASRLELKQEGFVRLRHDSCGSWRQQPTG